jgi:hypothetical protein
VRRSFGGTVRRTALALVLALGGISPGAASPIALTWEDLLPRAIFELEKEAFTLEESFAALEPRQREVFQAVAHELSVKERLASGAATEGDLSPEDLEVLQANPSAKHPEARAFWSQVTALQDRLRAQDHVVDAELNGKEVRIPGYLLPLEFSGTKVREFLLVPYVGACIHTPPPPPNQMVYVTVAHGYESEGLFAPVWVEGLMLASGGTYQLTFVDGTAPIDAGYTLEATKVEAYKP